MEKDFDAWNRRKKRLDKRQRAPYAYCREIWWCSLGINIGVETDGKNIDFERPVVILKIYNLSSLLVLPITTRPKYDSFHFRIQTDQRISWVKLTQARVVSSKRLLRKVNVIDQQQFEQLRAAWLKQI